MKISETAAELLDYDWKMFSRAFLNVNIKLDLSNVNSDINCQLKEHLICTFRERTSSITNKRMNAPTDQQIREITIPIGRDDEPMGRASIIMWTGGHVPPGWISVAYF